MTLLAEIQAKCTAEMLANRDDGAIAALVSVGRIKRIKTEVGVGTFLSEFNGLGGDFLNTLESMGASNANIKWTMVLINAGRLDLGNAYLQTQMDALAVALPIYAQGIANMQALGFVDDPVSATQIAQALEGL
jgi:hypothetical protein